MLKPSDIIEMARLPQRQVAAGVKIAAAILERSASISEAEARSIIKMDDLAWTHAKTALAKHFVFSRGRISFPGDGEEIDPWDIVTAEQLDKIQKRLDKHADHKAAAPLTPIQLVLHSLGGMTERQAVSFYHSQAAKYGHQAIIDAINTAAEKKPGEPKAYIIAILRKAALAVSTNGLSNTNGGHRFPLKILKYKPPPTPENARTEFVGWEAPISGSATPWPEGVRRKIWRLTSGALHYEKPSESDRVPTAEEDPGCIVLN